MPIQLSRRGFVGVAAGLGVCSSLASELFAAQETPLQLGIQLYSLRKFDLETALKHAADAGFTHVEFYSGMLATDASPEVVQDTLARV